VAGFLAPTLPDIAPAPRAPVAPADTSVGDALTGVAKIFDAAFTETGSKVRPTQKDRDTLTLQPFMSDIARLEAQREELGPGQFKARLNGVFSSFVSTNPLLVAEARAGVVGLTGLEIGTEEIDVLGSIEKNAISYLNTDEGAARLPDLMSRSLVDGELDNDLLVLNAIAAQAEDAKDDAELARLNVQLGIEQAKSGVNEVRLKGVVDEWLFKFGNEAQGHFQGVIRGALSTNATVADGTTVIGQLRDQRAQLANKFEAKARQGGFANHDDWDVSIPLRSYDNAIEALVRQQEDIPRLFEAMRASSSINLGETINAVTGVGGFQPEVIDYVFRNIIVGGSSELTALAEGLRASKTKATLVDRPLFSVGAAPVTEANPPTEGGAATPQAKVIASELSRDERQTEVMGGLANFGAYIIENGVDENYRATAVEGFTLASLAMTTSPQPVSVDVFDRMYDAKFFNTYTNITKFGDEVAGKLQTEVTHNLSVLFSQRTKLASTRITNSFDSVPSLGLSFKDGEIVLGFNTVGAGSTAVEKKLLARLDQFGLPRNMSGILRLSDLDPITVNAAGLGPIEGNLRDLRKEVTYLNKITSTVARLPDIAQHVLPRIEEQLAVRPVISSAEEYNEIVPNLPSGQEYIVIGSDGKPILVTRGSESFLFPTGIGDE